MQRGSRTVVRAPQFCDITTRRRSTRVPMIETFARLAGPLRKILLILSTPGAYSQHLPESCIILVAFHKFSEGGDSASAKRQRDAGSSRSSCRSSLQNSSSHGSRRPKSSSKPDAAAARELACDSREHAMATDLPGSICTFTKHKKPLLPRSRAT